MWHSVAQMVRRVKAWRRAVRFRPVPEWLTATEAAKYLRVDRTTIYRWEKAGLLRSYPLPIRGRRFKQADLDALLESGGDVDGKGTTRTR
jgi:excisionase family DNA binding protein